MGSKARMQSPRIEPSPEGGPAHATLASSTRSPSVTIVADDTPARPIPVLTSMRKASVMISADVNSLHVNHDGKFFVSGGADKKVNLWNYDEGSKYYTGEGHSGSVVKARFF